MALNTDFRVKNSLYVGTSACFNGVVNAPTFLSAGTDLLDIFIQDGEVSTSCTLSAGTGITTFAYNGTTNCEVSIDTACNSNWNSVYTTVDASSGSWDQSGCAGILCVGTVTSPGALLSGDGTTIGINSGALASLDQSACAGITCIGDITAVTTSTDYMTGGAASGSAEVGIDSACTAAWDAAAAGGGTITEVTTTSLLTGGGSAGSVEVGIGSGALTYLDQSACAGILCVGDVTGITTTGDYLTGGGTSGTFNIGIDSACAESWNNASAGSVSSVTGGDGIDSTGGTTPDISVDSTVARTDVAEVFTDNLTVQGNLSVTGEFTSIDTTIAVTSAMSIVNHGTGPALEVNQTGANDIIDIQDDGTSVFYIEDGGNVGIGTTDPDSTLDIAGTLSAQSSITGESIVKRGGTSSQFLMADGSVDTTTYTTCIGDITGVTTNAGISGGGASGSVTIGIDATTAAGFDQSACTGIDCIGTVTPSSSDTFTNKSGSNNQWTNDAGYTTCTGDIEGVTASTLLSGGGASGTVTIGINSGALAYLDQSACAGILCTGDVTGVTVSAGLSGGGASGDVTVGIDATTAAGFDQSGCAGILCTGDITNVTTSTDYMTGGASSGSAEVGIDSACTAAWDAAASGGITEVTTSSLLSGGGSSGSVEVGIDSGAVAYLDQSSCAGILCVGDITGVTTSAGSLLSGGSGAGVVCIGITSGALTPFDQSACAGILCIGDVEGITTTGDYLTGGGTSGTFNIGIDSACAALWNTGGGAVTSVTGGDGIDSTGGTTPEITVDNSVVRTTGDQTIGGCKTFTGNTTIQGDLSVTGGFTSIDTTVSVTSALSVTNHGTGPAIYAEQTGVSQPIAQFVDTEGGSIVFGDSGNVGIGIIGTAPEERLTVSGNISACGNIRACTGGFLNDVTIGVGAAPSTISSSGSTTLCLGSGSGTVEVGSSSSINNLNVSGTLTLSGCNETVSGASNLVLTCSLSGMVTSDSIDGKVWGGNLADYSGSTTTDTVPKFTGTGTIGDSSITDDGTTITLSGDVVFGMAKTFEMKSEGGTVTTLDEIFTGTIAATPTTVTTFLKSGLNSVKYEITLVNGVNVTTFEVNAVYNGTAPCGTTYAIVDGQAASQLVEIEISSAGTTIDLDITAASAATTATIYGKAKY